MKKKTVLRSSLHQMLLYFYVLFKYLVVLTVLQENVIEIRLTYSPQKYRCGAAAAFQFYLSAIAGTCVHAIRKTNRWSTTWW